MSENQQTLTIEQAIDLAVHHHNEGRLSQAESIYQQILQSDPNEPVALHLLGVIAHQVSKNEVAADLITKALTINPELAEAHSNLGTVLQDLGKLEDAITSYHKALTLRPDLADAHYNLGNALRGLGKFQDAIISYRKALDLKPDYAAANSNLGLTLQELDKPGEAFTQHRRAISLDPQNEALWASFAMSLEVVSFASVDDRLYHDLLNLLERPTVRPSYIVQSVISALHHHSDFSAIVESAGSPEQNNEFSYRETAKQLSKIPLFLRILELEPITDLAIEQALTLLRRSMIEETTAGKADETGLPFSVALTHNCFTNEYVFAETNKEQESVEKLEQQIATLMEKGRPVPPSFVVALGAYRPLFQFSWAEELSDRKWEDNIKSLTKRQITEPLEERALRNQIPCITPIRDSISQAVREQYEKNPYPRWVKTGLAYKTRDPGTILRGSPLFFDLDDYTSPESPEILVAGCGTGQHALVTASTYSNSHVLAVDLSLSSLSYAMRKTRELGLSNIEYVQGDLTELGQLERRFDLIECMGVLHHLDNPLAGWQVLVNLLRPGGLMKIGLYSNVARQHIILGRSLIAEKGYSTAPEDIRRCRQDIVAMATNGDTEMEKICSGGNFFSLSNCRDLLFHVREHLFTLPQIAETLTSLDLKFLGFEMRNQNTLRKLRELHPNRTALTSLSLQHKFELEHPNTFRNMYQFWCRKL